jgi:hypothetical protein
MDNTRKESARQRATRKWHNERIIRQLQNHPEPSQHQKVPQTLRYELMQIFSAKNQETIRHYIIAINERKKRLLREKLRRLKAEQTSE